jgi:hypothetical protein
MVNYNNGKIYKIVCNTTGLVYIGSTTKNKLCERLTQHKSRFKKYNEGDNIKYSSFLVLENNNYNIILIENYKCNNKDELTARERYYIEKIECVNSVIPGRTRKERDNLKVNKIKKSISDKKYYEKNKIKIRESGKDYRKNYNNIRNNWWSSMGGNPFKNNMSLLKIDTNLFN